MPDVCREKMPNGDAAPSGGSLGEIAGDRVVEGEAPLFREHHNRRRSELLADGAGLVYGAIARRHAELDVGVPVPVRQHDAVAAEHGDGHAGDAVAAELRSHVVVYRIEAGGALSPRRCGHHQLEEQRGGEPAHEPPRRFEPTYAVTLGQSHASVAPVRSA